MTPMLQVSPLSPERVCASWESGTFMADLCQPFSHEPSSMPWSGPGPSCARMHEAEPSSKIDVGRAILPWGPLWGRLSGGSWVVGEASCSAEGRLKAGCSQDWLPHKAAPILVIRL